MPPHSIAPEPSPVVVPESPLVSNARLRQIYTLMLQCRVLRARIGSLIAEGRIVAELLPPGGEEAALAATAVELRPGDRLFCARRDWLPAMLKGVPLEKITRWLLASSGSRQRALSDAAHGLQALSSRPEAQLADILEAATVCKRRKGSLVQAHIRSKIPADTWEQTLRIAARRRLPLIFICHTGAGQPQAHDYEFLTQASQTPHIHVDGGDALAVYRVVQEATGRARRGLGATLIECRIDESAESVALGAFLSMEDHLAAKGVFSTAWKDETETAFAQQLETALHSAEKHLTS